MSENMSSPARIGGATRTYRCQKRQKPCDHCRERKLKCQTSNVAEGGGQQQPCQRCARSNIACTFVGRPRRRGGSAGGMSNYTPMEDGDGGGVSGATANPDNTITHHPSATPISARDAGIQEDGVSTPLDYTTRSHDASIVPICDISAPSAPAAALNTPTSSTYHANGSGGRVSTQLSQTMDGIDGHSIMLLGASSESDPWLLRHCHFDQLGLRSVHKMYFRNAGGVPTIDKIPIHFIVSDDKYLSHPLQMPYAGLGENARQHLNQLVLPSYGVRLISL